MYFTVLYTYVLYSSILYINVLYTTVQSVAHFKQCRTSPLHCTSLRFTASLHFTALSGRSALGPQRPNNLKIYCTRLHFYSLHCTVLHCTALHCDVLQYTTLHFTILYCTTLHFTALDCMRRKSDREHGLESGFQDHAPAFDWLAWS